MLDNNIEEINENNNMTKIEELLQEFIEQRNKLKEMVNKLEKLSDQVDRLFPTNFDARYARFFEEKVKSATEMFKAILEIRKEIIKCSKEEIEIRRRNGMNDDDNLLDQLDVAKIISSFEKSKKKAEKVLSNTQK